MSPHHGPTIVLCKWRAELVHALLAVTSNLYLVLDESDVARADFDETVLTKVRGVYRIGDFDSIEELTGVAVEISIHNIDVHQVLSLSEDSQLGANHLRTLLRCGAKDELILAAARDKRLMKELVGRAGVPVATWASILPGTTDVTVNVGFPAVVKPAFGFGTMNTVRVDSPEELSAAVSQLPKLARLKSDHLIIEQFIHGRELHIDALWHGGKPLFFLVSAYYVPRLAHIEGESDSEKEATRDGSYILRQEDHPGLYKRLLELQGTVNQALDIATAITHLEVFETPTGDLVFSEVATRMGGGWIPDMISAYLGHTVYDAIASGLLLGQIEEPKPPYPYIGALHLLPRRAGTITSMPTSEEIRTIDGVLSCRAMKAVGDTVGFANAMDWCLVVVIGAETAQKYGELADRIETQLVITVQ